MQGHSFPYMTSKWAHVASSVRFGTEWWHCSINSCYLQRLSDWNIILYKLFTEELDIRTLERMVLVDPLAALGLTAGWGYRVGCDVFSPRGWKKTEPLWKVLCAIKGRLQLFWHQWVTAVIGMLSLHLSLFSDPSS